MFTPIHEAVAVRARSTPHAPAVTDPAGTLTYGALVERADALAARLVAAGVRPGDAVAVHLPRGGALLVTLLAVSRAGAGSLMLDVDGPPRWLARFVEIARPSAWVGPGESGFDGPTFAIAADGTVPGETPDVTFPEVGPEDLACLVQTSGTTGEPKLVLVPHRTWTYAADTQQVLHAVTPRTRGAWLFPAHTNVSVSVVVWPFLAAGAQLFVPDPGLIGVPEDLAGWIRDRGIDQFFAVAPLAEALARLDWPPSALKLMLTGSDRVREWGRPDLPFEIGNWYGANEVNIVTSSIVPWEQRITSATAGPQDRSGPPPIGQVWPGATWRVLDGDRPVAPGGVGELVVGGEQLAIGYHAPRKTAARFLPDPDGSGGRVYRTGDLVRARPDGVLEHCGRADEQVKINGVRVEMAEVERSILALPGVVEAAAAAVPTPSGRDQLVGYVVLEQERTDADLRAGLAEDLPAHMVPVAFVRMDELPRNRGDKIDRRALPHPDDRAADGARDDVAALVGSVMADVLKLESYGSEDNFFLHGGDSILAAKAAKELTSRLDAQEISAKEVLMHPTAGELAAFIKQG